MLRTFDIIDGKVQSAEGSECRILAFFNPDELEKKYLTADLNIDEHTLNSSLDPDELARLEFEPDHLALIYKRPKNYSAKDLLLFRVTSMGLFVFNDRIVLVSGEEIPLFDDKRFNKVSSLKDVTLKIFFRSIFHYLEHLKIINMISDDLEDKINLSMENRYLLNLFTLEKSLVYYLNAINGNSIVLQKLKNYAGKIGFTQVEEELLDDLMIENSQCYKQSEIYSNILSGLMDARVSIVSNNLNVLMKTLNIITIGIMVPTFVVSAFSMNVSIPLEKHPFAFFIILGLALVSVMGFMFFWRYKKW
jgi:magnesium transporter